MFDIDNALAIELHRGSLNNKITVPLLTDRKIFFDMFSKESKTPERRLMFESAATSQAFNRHDISDIGFVQSEEFFSDGLTKEMNQEKTARACTVLSLYASSNV